MQKGLVNRLYILIAATFVAIFLVDTLLKLHPIGNIVGGIILLVACYEIGRAHSK